MSNALIPADYAAWLLSLKEQIRRSRVKASLSVNTELVMLYWRIGRAIVQQRAAQSWGSKVLEQLAKDLKSEFPDMRGLSLTNLKYTAIFADAWPENSIGHQLGGQIPWRHNCTILEQVKDRSTREWYIKRP